MPWNQTLQNFLEKTEKKLKQISIIGGGSNSDLVNKITKLLGIKVNNITSYFSNTEIRPLLHHSVNRKTIYIIQTGASTKNKSINDYLIELYLYIRTCKSKIYHVTCNI